MKILAVTNMYPMPAHPASGTFIAEQVESLRRLGNDVETLLVDREVEGARAYRSVGGSVRRAIAEHRPDVVHAMYGGIMAQRVAASCSARPLVVSLCGSDTFGASTGSRLGRLSAGAGVLASRLAARRASRIIAKSSAIADAARRWSPTPVHVIPNGVDLDRFRPGDRAGARDRLGWSPDSFHILFGGQPRPVKRPELAKKAVDLVRLGDRDVALHIPEGVTRDDMATWMVAADVLLVTSAHEGSPNIVKEALACDLAVVSVDVGDVRERIGRVAGCHVTGESPDDIAAALVQVAGQEIAVNGRAAIADLAIDRTARRVLDVYELAIAGGS